MIFDAVFISDLHLHPKNTEIQQKFWDFVDWAKNHTKSVYILGDFFHVWVGDDNVDRFSLDVIAQLNVLHEKGISLYFMAGNRDFLIGDLFFKKANITILPDPTVVQLDGERIFLTHGDRYCSKDWLHQVMIFFTRNPWFKKLALKIPLQYRQMLVNQVRNFSQSRKNKGYIPKYQLTEKHLCRDMHKFSVDKGIYGHVHQPEKKTYEYQNQLYTQYVLSDWDKDVIIVCYNKQNGLSLCNFSKVYTYDKSFN